MRNENVTGMSVPQHKHDREKAIAELKHQWHGYAELGPMLMALGAPVCMYKLSDGSFCGAPIHLDDTSYSGWWHDNKADWLHWAAPFENHGEPDKIFLLCAKCGKTGDGNEAHIRYNGHRFTLRKP